MAAALGLTALAQWDGRAVQFNISFDGSSPDLGSLTTSEQQAILDTANAAATIWSWYLTPANVTLDLQITIDNSLFSGGTVAIGGARFHPDRQRLRRQDGP